MSRWNSYLRSAEEICLNYDGRMPLSHWLKEYFREHKKMGSTDRKIIASLVYQYYRTCKAFAKLPFEKHVLAARFLCVETIDKLLEALAPHWAKQIAMPLPEKKSFLSAEYKELSFDFFHLSHKLSNGIAHAKFNDSFVQQPQLFLRIRPGFSDSVCSRLKQAGVDFTLISASCLALENQTQIETVLDLNREVVVQDYNSQRVGEFLHLQPGQKVWDCCAASGGKSIMAYDLSPEIELTVSDIRDSILENLRKRFREAGIEKYRSFTADLTSGQPLRMQAVDRLIADLPCSGSGTWSRTPEQLCFFDESRIAHYSNLQKAILRHVVPTLKTGGQLVYITCSVFKEENEAVADFACRDLGLHLLEMEVLKGYDKRADTLFVAILEKR